MLFKVGQKVVCINACNGAPFDKYGAGAANGLVEGQIYTVLGIRDEFISVDKVNRNAWYADRFRPLVERKTDISIFTKMLDGVKSKEPVRC